MFDLQPNRSVNSLCRLRLFFLAFLWLFSFGIGIVFSQYNRDATVSLMCTAPLCRVSIFGLVVTLLFPLLISAAAVHFSIPYMIFPVAVLKGISFGYCLFGSFLAFGSSSWLVYGFLAFSETIMLVPQLWLWALCLTRNASSLKKELSFCILAALIFGMIDYFIVSPFLGILMF